MMLGIAASVFFACSKDESASDSGTSTLKIRMTDAPADWDEVNIDIQKVRINYDDDSTGWVDLQTTAGVYDLLTLQNGVDTLIAQGTVPSGKVKEVRFVLGDNNTIVVDGTSYPLTIPSGSTSGLKIKVDKNLTAANIDSLLLDFDAGMSVKNESGSYKLRPVIKLK